MSTALRYLQTIVEYGSMTQAASVLFISQPALSRYITRLEESVGVKLIDRTVEPLILTPEGHRYTDYLQASEKLRISMEADIQGMKQMSGETVSLGATEWRTLALMPRVLPKMLEIRQDLRIDIHGMSNADLLAGVRSKKLDLAVMYAARAGIGVHFQKIADEHVLIVGDAVSKLFAGRERGAAVSATRLKSFLQNERLILMHQDRNIGAVSRDFLTKLGVRPRRVMNINNVMTMVDLAVAGMGVTFAAESMTGRAEYSDIPYVRVEHADLVQEIGLAWPSDQEPIGAVKDLADLLTCEIIHSSRRIMLPPRADGAVTTTLVN